MQQRLSGILLVVLTASAMAQDLPLQLIKLPPGFKIEVYAANVPDARSMSLSPDGTLFVGSRHAGKVYAIRDTNQDGRGDKVYVIAQGLNRPNGVAFYHGGLFVAEIDRILRFDDIEKKLANPPSPVLVSADFPAEQHHGWKFIRMGPDGKLYVPIGAPCNVCLEYGYAVITRLNPDGSEHEIYAEGVRNTVGFDWHPDTRELWFTDNGRDGLGDDIPPDELNRAPAEGLHFGFPYCHGGEVLDPEFGLGHRCQEYVAPARKLGAHVASLGMRFYTGRQFPAPYRKQIFIAEHGSWNRSRKIGYRITLVALQGNDAVSYEVFAEGWLQGQQAWGRPVDLALMPDGSLLVSDDKAGVIYRIYYAGSQTNAKPTLSPAIDKMKLEKNSIRQQAPVEGRAAATKTTPAMSPEGQQPQITHEKALRHRQKTPGPEVNEFAHDRQRPPGDEPPRRGKADAIPPAEIVESVGGRPAPNTPPAADPFSPLNKQTVNQ